MPVYYNEIDAYAAQWLRNLIAAGHIAPGDVDERSIAEVQPDDLRGYTQCHFFAGIGVWSHALRRAGWGDDTPVWTGSCPCQPFSVAGNKGGFDDARHLWPHWFRLIAQCNPPIVLGEQVASALDWLDLVQTDMEAAGYAFGASDLCAAGFGGAHIRQRLYFVALEGLDNATARQREWRESCPERRYISEQRRSPVGLARHHHQHERPTRQHPSRTSDVAGPSETVGVGVANSTGSFAREQGITPTRHWRSAEPTSRSFGLAFADDAERGAIGARGDDGDGQDAQRQESPSNAQGRSGDIRLADADGRHASTEGLQRSGQHGQQQEDSISRYAPRPGSVDGGWRDTDWLLCRDGKWRPVEPGTFPLAHAAPSRVGRLRAYGNGLDAETATQFIAAVREIVGVWDLV